MPLSHRERPPPVTAEQGACLPSPAAEEAIERILCAQTNMWKQIASCDPMKRREGVPRACMTRPSIVKVKAAQAALLQALLAAEWEPDR